MPLATFRTLLITVLFFTAATAAYAAKTKVEQALGWMFVVTWFGLVGLVSAVIWFLVKLDRRTMGIEQALNNLNQTLAAISHQNSGGNSG